MHLQSGGTQRERRCGQRRPTGPWWILGLVSVIVAGTLAIDGLALGADSYQPPPFQDLRTAGAPGILQVAAATTAEPDLGAVIQSYCVACHNQHLRTADLALDSVDPSDPGRDPAVWEKVVTKLRTGTMPPTGIPRPDQETYELLAEWLEGELDNAWARNPNPGRISAVHRMNRTEYNNAVRDLLRLDIDIRDQLPGDETTDGGFDNVASALTISTAHLERYMSVARQVTRLATGLPPAAPGVEVFRVDDLRWQDERMSEDLPIGSRGGTSIRHHFPADGEYEISVRLTTNYAEYVRGMGWPQELDIRLDGTLLDRFVVGGGGLDYRPVSASYAGAGDGPGWAGAPEWEEYMQSGAQEGLLVRVPVKAGPAVVGVSFPRYQWVPEDLVPNQPLRLWGLSEKNHEDYMGFAGVAEVYIDGPYQVAGPPEDSPSRREIFSCNPSSTEEELACAEEILARMARRAYRRPVEDGDLKSLMEFFELGREEGRGFDAGIQLALERILVDPDFLLRIYREPQAGVRVSDEIRGSEGLRWAALVNEDAGDPNYFPLTDLEVASRLSFFLWSSLPDEELITLAEEGRLTQPEILAGQVDRMLQDQRTHRALVDGFASQWLMLRVLDEQTLDERLYPDFDHNLLEFFRTESELFVESTLREDRSVIDLLTADYTYVNERMARHYDIPGVYGSHFRRVALPDLERRGGLLGHASVLTVSSYPDRTTPVLRGKWLLENILGSHVPEPPPEVDTSLQEEEDPEEGAGLSIRERLAQHRANPACSSCHSVIDPLGFALENYDAMGGWRTVDERGNAVDNIGAWPNGMEMEGLWGLREVLLSQREQFVGNVTEKLMSYALGRTTAYYDRPVIRRIVRNASEDDYRWSTIIHGIVQSPQFLMQARTKPVTSSR